MSIIDPRDEWAVRDGKVPALAEHPRLCERCGKEPREAVGTLCAGCLQGRSAPHGGIDAHPGLRTWVEPAELRYGRADQQEAFKIGLDREFPYHDLRARCELLVQRWSRAETGDKQTFLRCAIALQEVLEETE